MLLTSVITLLAAGAVSALPAASAVTCSSGVHVIVARGTFEPQGYGLQQIPLNAILAKIPGSSSSAVVYPASPAVSDSIAAGIKDTQQQITDYYNACPQGKIVLMGYSQGASVVGNALAGGGQPIPPAAAPGPAATPLSQTIGANVVAIVFFGDYNRVKGQGQDNAPQSCAVSASGARKGANYNAMQFYADRLDEYCDPQDPVCCSSGANILAHLSYFTPQNSDAIANYVAAKFNAAR